MDRRVRIEVDPSSDEEIVIKCRELTHDVLALKSEIESGARAGGEDISLTLGGREYFVSLKDVLFFESSDDRTAAHTGDHMYYTGRRLFELTGTLPGYFMRVSKSCIVNLKLISSIHRDVAGVCEVCFSGSQKKIYVSRMYYKAFRERLIEVRLGV